MVTHWKTDPIMETQPRQPRRINQLHRPQIYVNLEFGVSWSQAHLPNRHGIEYRSRGLRDKGSYSRQVPPPNTNYLEQIPVVAFAYPYTVDDSNQLHLYYHQDQSLQLPVDSNYQFYPPEQSEQQQQQTQHVPIPLRTSSLANPQESPQRASQTANITSIPSLPVDIGTRPATQTTITSSRDPVPRGRQFSNPRRFQPQLESPIEEPEEQRPSREARTPVHSRGRSAPPPIADSPWNVQAQPAVFQFTQQSVPSVSSPTQSTGSVAMQGRSISQGDARLWKALPEPPTSFRLGEEGMPWEALSWPMGYEPEADPEHTRVSSSYPGERRLPSSFPTAASSRYSPQDGSANMTYLPYSPIPVANIQVTSPVQTPGVARPSAATVTSPEGRDLGALSVAMMTIDNGFESQWWNQGEREAIQVRTAPTTPVLGNNNNNNNQEDAARFISPDSAHQQLRMQDFSAATLGWAVATPPLWQQSSRSSNGPSHGHQHQPSNAPSFNTDSIVSPMTPPTYFNMRRTLSTRSDDAYSTMGRYA
ncbi:hypothetical protein MCOR27_011473 [Pyricularia oryzae]|uniref:Uncharacterized protein n=4 Tax=Pyricularia TaxID=48558 RepID=A0ABQ8N4N0_PYRGI|nr:hypothetical protein MCOR01_004970 [Pyricularia oryzae]KAI6291184.1 hypothetical protein MCOR33_010786 [Pyricularia grisea]KAH9431716.1 hypothetical protein MCOR02_009002 [Pyricularia oryzae]KAI6252865.1 hypothetical protein MCOR19_010555 [Pyricularia oryzae]KAI6264246.1 hypothetical protein MCOR26_011480 [Pyricularia oryzae]